MIIYIYISLLNIYQKIKKDLSFTIMITNIITIPKRLLNIVERWIHNCMISLINLKKFPVNQFGSYHNYWTDF